MISRRNMITGALASFAAATLPKVAKAEDRAYAAKLAAAYKKGQKAAKPGLGAGSRG